ncbi:hypothetical protein CALCODRAFT_491505 [Calocera cornea HHB12733]|uniref:SUN domain-containing protein n=1 Tax=Calocera cornea HHB12733 TaxID=1353952 RepID=A0A165IY82_9BASI|nr:hypothetical protein CALCODRAFT_491505 [Calocera cornea HHB12733]
MRLDRLALPLLAVVWQHGAAVRAEVVATPALTGRPFDAFLALRGPICLPDLPPEDLEPNPTTDAPPPEAPREPAPVEDSPSEFLSFEEWKARQIAQGVPTDAAKPGSSGQAADGTAPAAPAGAHEVQLAPPLVSAPPLAAAATTGPRIAIPLTDRYNYASDDCSARVHASSKGTKNPSAILSRKKDRYMLHECNGGTGGKWVEVELCDHIWVDTVQLANYEFFSGVFRNVSIYLSPRYPPGPEGWVHAGTFEARNVRSVQSFHPPPEIKGFHRFLRVEFESYYGAEFYCPVSLLRVYGLNEMEEWKRDAWEAEAEIREREVREREQERLKREWEERAAAQLVRETRTIDVLYVSTEEAKKTTMDRQATSDLLASTISSVAESSASDRSTELPSSESSGAGPTSVWISRIVTSSTVATPPSSPTARVKFETGSRAQEVPTSVTQEAVAASSPIELDAMRNATFKDERVDAVVIEKVVGNDTTVDAVIQNEDSASTMVMDAPGAADTATHEPVAASTPASSPAAVTESGSEASSSTSAGAASTTLTTPPQSFSSSSSSSSSSSTTTTSVQQTPSYTLSVVPPSIPTGESIYRTIMNRLTLLEVNTTLGTRYMEEQSRMMQEAFKRLERGVEERWGEGRWREVARGWEGKLEGLTAEQRQAFDSAMNVLEQQRERMEVERKELVSQIHMLENEVVLEKRLSVAQLCLLVVVLFVMTLTRGPDWALISTAFRPSISNESRAATPAHLGVKSAMNLDDAEVTPTRRRSPSAGSLTPVRRSSIPFPSSPSHAPPRSPKPAAPRSSRFHHSSHSSHPSLPFRASTLSFNDASSPRRRATGGPGTIPGNAKRLARTAHLHELRNGKENIVQDTVYDTPLLRDRSHSRGRRFAQDDAWEDTDVDDMAGGQSEVLIVDAGPRSARDLRGMVSPQVLVDEPPDTARF